MPRPIPVPVRHAMFRLWEQAYTPRQIAETLGLSSVSVRRLVRRFRGRGRDGIAPDYPLAHIVSPLDSEVAKATLGLRREHPTWGAGLIRVQLLQEASVGPVPSTRTLQRWLLQADLAPALAGRRPKAAISRATAPHETWQMDAKERVKIKSCAQVSWLRLVDECSGAALWTAVFPPRDLESGPRLGRPRPVAPGVRPLGATRGLSGRQRRAVGVAGGVADRTGVVGDRVGGHDDLEHPSAASRERRGRAVAGDG
jgi:hypothetical protein